MMKREAKKEKNSIIFLVVGTAIASIFDMTTFMAKF